MKLQLSIFAQDLKAEGGCNPFAVVAQVHPESDKQPTVIGKTETLRSTTDPDFTKIFILNNFQLGKPMHIIVTIHDETSNESLGSAMYDVGAILGTKGGILGKEVKSGGLIMAHVERCSGSGSLNLKMRGVDLKSKQEDVDAFFELQKKRKTTSGDDVWDTVFRSRPVKESINPIWDDACLELSTLCRGKKSEQFRVAVKDWDAGDKDSLIGYFRVSVDELLAGITEGADATNVDEINMEKAFIIKKKGKKDAGKAVVIAASTSDTEQTERDIVMEPEEEISVAPMEEDEDIVVEATDDIEIVPDELFGGANFADYISGGCQLRVIVAIDFTASNGDPRKEESLHHFKKDGMNMYQTAISKMCTMLTKYDSDQKYPVWGFGAKLDGELNNCFPCGEQAEADGVDGILEAYKNAFQTGIAMSKPTNVTEVIQGAGKAAKKCLDTAMESGNQEYSILIIFTNGNVHSVEETVAALDEVRDEPLSIVIVGVGPGEFRDMSFLNERQQNGDRVQFVDMKAHQENDDALSEETLKEIPEQMVKYFESKEIGPSPPVEADEIVIEPFNEEEEVKADIVISESGDIQVESDAKPPSAKEDDKKNSKLNILGGKGKQMILTQGKRMLARQTKMFGRIQTNMQRKMDKFIEQKINTTFGLSSAKPKPKPKPVNKKNNNRR